MISLDVSHSGSLRLAGLASLRDQAAPGDPRIRRDATTARGRSGKGIVAWSSLTAGNVATSRVPGIGAALDAVGNGIAAAVGRGQDLARRLLTGGTAEPGMAPALGGAARTAGVCGAAAVACVASGLVGPGVGGVVDVLADQRREKPVVERTVETPESTRSVTTAPEVAATSVPQGDAEASTEEDQKRKQSSKSPTRKRQTQRPSTTPSTATPSQVAEEFDPFTGGGETSSSGSTSGGGGSASSQPSTSTGGNSSSPPSASGQQVQSEFGL
jgi:hypothetical protein